MAYDIERAPRVERLAVDALRLDPQNPRLHSDRQIKQIAQSIKSFDFNVPVLIDSNNKVLAGHGRVLAARKLGLRDVPVIRLGHLTEAQARAFAIADNRLTDNSVWDDRVLGEIFRDLSVLDLDFSIEATGFSMGEIDLRIDGLSSKIDENSDPADQLSQPNGQIPVSKPGDCWTLGRHRVLCGNALDPKAYDSLMQGEQATLIFTDPPYNVPIDGHVSGLGANHHREFAMASGEMSQAEFMTFLTVVCSLLVLQSIDGAIHFICMDWRHVGELIVAGKRSYSELKNICIWVKHNAGMGSFYRSQHELVFVFKAGHASHRNNVELGRHGRHRTNVWTYPGANSFGRATEEGSLLDLHPTVKPIRLIADAILDCSARGDIVLDPFLGSGSSVIAAERTGRRCYGIEIDPLYVDTAVRRWQAYTGGTAYHLENRQSFSQIEKGAAVPNDADNNPAKKRGEDYSVGYGKPPAHSRFKKGHSGNRKGRPKGSLNFTTLIDQEMSQSVTINENGVRKRISKKEAVAKQLVNKAASGDPKAMPLLLSHERQREGIAGASAGEPAVVAEEDKMVMESIVRRIRESVQPGSRKQEEYDPSSATSEATSIDGEAQQC